jgi:hypothetical protein
VKEALPKCSFSDQHIVLNVNPENHPIRGERTPLRRAQPQKKQVQAMWWGEHLRAQLRKKQVQAMRRVKHLRAQPPKKRVQGMRRGEHLRAQPPKKQVQGIRREKLPRAQPQKKPVPSNALGMQKKPVQAMLWTLILGSGGEYNTYVL